MRVPNLQSIHATLVNSNCTKRFLRCVVVANMKYCLPHWSLGYIRLTITGEYNLPKCTVCKSKVPE